MNANDNPTHVSFCGTCIFWQGTTKDDKGNLVGGVCRRNPPTPFIVQVPGKLVGTHDVQLTAQFPPTPSGGWCGEHADIRDEGFADDE